MGIGSDEDAMSTDSLGRSDGDTVETGESASDTGPVSGEGGDTDVGGGTGFGTGEDGTVDTDTGGEDTRGEARMTDSTGAGFVTDCGSGSCAWVPESPEAVQPACVDAFLTVEGERLLVCGVVVVSSTMTSMPWSQCRPAVCQEAADCPASDENRQTSPSR